jgi:hypothetical protein
LFSNVKGPGMSRAVSHPDIGELERILKKYAQDFAVSNPAAKAIFRGITVIGVGVRPILDHFLFRTRQPAERVLEFTALGYEKDSSAIVLGHPKNAVSVYRCRCLPAVLIEEAQDRNSLEWVEEFGDSAPYVMAVRVDDIEESTFHLEKQAVQFLRPGAGKPGEEVRAIAAMPFPRNGRASTVLVLAERHAGNMSYYAPDFWNKA